MSLADTGASISVISRKLAVALQATIQRLYLTVKLSTPGCDTLSGTRDMRESATINLKFPWSGETMPVKFYVVDGHFRIKARLGAGDAWRLGHVAVVPCGHCRV